MNIEKQARQFAPFVALVVAAGLVVIADPGDRGPSESASSPPATVAGITAVRDAEAVTPATIPSDPSAAGADVAPFAPAAGSSSSFSPSTPSSSSFAPSSSGSATSGGSSVTPTAPAATATPEATTTTTTAPAGGDTTTTTSPPFIAPTTTVPGTETASGGNFYLFDQVASPAVCSAGGDPQKPLVLASAFAQTVVASEPSFPDRATDLTTNKADPDPERYLYRTHSLIANSSVSLTDTVTGASAILAQRTDWERLDGILWTPRKTMLVGENIQVQERPDPVATTAKAGLVYEVNPATGTATVRPLLGAKAHRGMTLDHLGNVYSVSAALPGYIYRFVPGGTLAAPDYSTGTLSALSIGANGESMWLALPADQVVVDADAAAAAAGATPFASPEDAKALIVTSPTGARRSQLFVAEAGADRVITIILRTTTFGTATVPDNTAYASVYVARGLNAPTDFTAPSRLMIDTTYNLYIAERNGGGGAATKTEGDDIWVAPANASSALVALDAGRLAGVTDCDATPNGLMFDLTGSKLYLNLTGRGGDGRDLTILLTPAGGV